MFEKIKYYLSLIAMSFSIALFVTLLLFIAIITILMFLNPSILAIGIPDLIYYFFICNIFITILLLIDVKMNGGKYEN